jgi:hypothetical protein
MVIHARILLHHPESLMTLLRLAVEVEEGLEEVVVIVEEAEAAAAAAEEEEGAEEVEVEVVVEGAAAAAAEGVVKEVTAAMATTTSVLPAVRHALAVVQARAEVQETVNPSQEEMDPERLRQSP